MRAASWTGWPRTTSLPIDKRTQQAVTKMTDSKIESARKLLASGVPAKDVANNLGVSVPTLYRWVPASTQA